MNTLKCYKCGKPRGKRHGWCTKCNNKYSKAYRKKHPYSTFSEERKHKARCRGYASSYLRLGKIERGPCEVEGCKEKPQMHHEDYNKPLMIRWLCEKHHRELHAQRSPPICPRCKSAKKHIRANGTTPGYCLKCSSEKNAERQRKNRIRDNPHRYNPDGSLKLKWDQTISV